jgi:hypothetical protein
MSTSQPDETFLPLLYVFLGISFPFSVFTKQSLGVGKVAKTFHENCSLESFDVETNQSLLIIHPTSPHKLCNPTLHTNNLRPLLFYSRRLLMHIILLHATQWVMLSIAIWHTNLHTSTSTVYCKIHRRKRFASFPSPAGMSLPNSPWAGIMTS